MRCAGSGCGRRGGDGGHTLPRRSAAVWGAQPHGTAALGSGVRLGFQVERAGGPSTNQAARSGVCAARRQATRRTYPIWSTPKAAKGSPADGPPVRRARWRAAAAAASAVPPTRPRLPAAVPVSGGRRCRSPARSFSNRKVCFVGTSTAPSPRSPCIAASLGCAHCCGRQQRRVVECVLLPFLFGVSRDKGDHAALWLPTPFHLEYAPAVWVGRLDRSKNRVPTRSVRECPSVGETMRAAQPQHAHLPATMKEQATNPEACNSPTPHAKLTLR